MTKAATRRGVHDQLAALDPPNTAGTVRAGTFPVRIEFVRQILRRRTHIIAGLLTVLPLVAALAFELGGQPKGGPREPGLVALATNGAANFTLFVEFAVQGFLIVVVIALFCGDTVASEANWASLRYLLTAPVPRSRLLRKKLIVALGLSAAANVWLPLVAYVTGGAFFGWAPAQLTGGPSIDGWDLVGRFAVIVGYCCLTGLVTAGFAFVLSVLTDAPLGAVGGAVMVTVVSEILDQITALDPYRQYLPTHFHLAWTDTLNAPIVWDDMFRGAGSRWFTSRSVWRWRGSRSGARTSRVKAVGRAA